MKRIISLLTAGIITSSLFAYEGGSFYYTPKRYTKSDLFSLELGTSYLNFKNATSSEGDLGVDFGISKRYVWYVGNTDINFGIKGLIRGTGVKIKDNSLFIANGEVGPTIGYDITKKTNFYVTGGYSYIWAKNFTAETSSSEDRIFYGIGTDFYINKDLIISLEGKEYINKDNKEDKVQVFRIGLRFPFWN